MKIDFFSTDFLKNSQTLNFMKIRPARAELFRADRRTHGRTDMTKLIVVVRNFGNASNNGKMFEKFMCAHPDRNSLCIYRRKQYFEIADN
jgi:hypothetical protein